MQAADSSMALAIVAVVCLTLFGCRSEPEEARVTWNAPRLQELDRLLLRFHGPSTGRYVVEYFGADGRAPAPQERSVVDLTAATFVSRELKGLTVSPTPPIAVVTVVKIRPISGSDTGTASTYTVDPNAALDRFFSRVDELSGSQLARLLTDLSRLRKEHERSVETSRFDTFVETRRQLKELLKERRFSAPGLRRFRDVLSRLCQQPIFPGSPVARRLLPLRYAESILNGRDELTAPWGNVSWLLGYRYTTLHDIPPSKGWSIVARKVVAKKVSVPEHPHRIKYRWLWMATEPMIRLFTESSDESMPAFAMRYLIDSRFSQPPDPKEYRTSVEFALDPVGETPMAWPPAAARLDVLVSFFARETALRVTINGGSTAVVMNGVYSSIKQGDFEMRDPLGVSFPVDPSLIARQGNKVVLTVEAFPHQQPPLPLRVKEVSLRVSSGEV